MQYISFIFGIFGFLAYLEITSMKNRISELERQLSRMDGTSYSENRASLASAVKSYIGDSVSIEFKEDHGDTDIQMYGNTKHGKNTIVDADNEWILVRTESAKGVKEKLIRLESIKGIHTSEDNK